MSTTQTVTSHGQDGQMLHLPPEAILADPKNNARYGLKVSRIKELAQEITDKGGVMEPIEVSPIPGSVPYRLTFGNYRLAAVMMLNEQGAGLTIPAIVKRTSEGLESLMRNLSENIARQDLTPMDQAHAIQLLTEGGVDKLKIREMFARPGRRGPASNSWVNTTIGFLDLPRKVQNQIHEGQIDWAGAAELVKVNRDGKEDLPSVLADLEKERTKAIAREEREEEWFLSTLAKAEEARNKAASAAQQAIEAEQARAAKLEAAKTAVQAAKSEGAAKVAKADTALKAATLGVAEDQSTTAEVAMLAKDAASIKKEVDASIVRAQKTYDALMQKEKEAAEAARAKAKEAEEARREAAREAKAAKEGRQVGAEGGRKRDSRAAKAKTKTTSAASVKKAVARVTRDGRVLLTRSEIMKVAELLALPGGTGRAEVIVTSIGKTLLSTFNSVITDKQCYSAILKLVANCK